MIFFMISCNVAELFWDPLSAKKEIEYTFPSFSRQWPFNMWWPLAAISVDVFWQASPFHSRQYAVVMWLCRRQFIHCMTPLKCLEMAIKPQGGWHLWIVHLKSFISTQGSVVSCLCKLLKVNIIGLTCPFKVWHMLSIFIAFHCLFFIIHLHSCLQKILWVSPYLNNYTDIINRSMPC